MELVSQGSRPCSKIRGMLDPQGDSMGYKGGKDCDFFML